MAGDNINLYYDLIDSVAARTYDKRVSSQDIFTAGEGDGRCWTRSRRPGRSKKLPAPKETLGADFSGKIGLEVRGRLYIPLSGWMVLTLLSKDFVQLKSLDGGHSTKYPEF